MEIKNPENYFYVCNGAVLKSLPELVSELNSMDDSAFMHHVNEEKNDFSNWIKDILENKSLAKKVSSLKDKKQIADVVEKAIEVPIKKGKRNKKEIISSIKENISNGE